MGRASGKNYFLTEAEVAFISFKQFQPIGKAIKKLLHSVYKYLISTKMVDNPLFLNPSLIIISSLMLKVTQFHSDGYITLPDVLSEEELVPLEEIYMKLIRNSLCDTFY